MMLITTNVKDRLPLFLDAAYAREAIEVLYRVQELHIFFLYGFVIMPDHCHLLIRITEEIKMSKIMNRFKMGLSHSIGKGPIWQARFDCRIVRDPWRALKYIHQNPVKAGLCIKPEDYPWSSASGKWDVMELEGW